jgi:hypothetical protein
LSQIQLISDQKFLLAHVKLPLIHRDRNGTSARRFCMPHFEALSSAPLRHDAWSVGNAHCVSRFQILAEAEADVLCRLLNLFAMQYLIPHQVSVMQQEGMLMVNVEVGGMTWHRAQVIGEKMRNLVSVCSVELEPIGDLHVVTEAVSLAAS